MTLGAIVSFAALQVGWFACVLGAARGHATFGPLIVLAALVAHVRLRPSGARAREVGILVAAALVGFFVDTALLRSGMIAIDGARFSPAWLIVLWPNTAAAMASGGSLAALERRPFFAVLAGAVAAPFSYDAGEHFGAIALGNGRVAALAIIGLVWAGVLAMFFLVRERLGRPASVQGCRRIS